METLDRGGQGHCCHCGLRRQYMDTRDWDTRHMYTRDSDTRDMDIRDWKIRDMDTMTDCVHGKGRPRPRYNKEYFYILFRNYFFSPIYS